MNKRELIKDFYKWLKEKMPWEWWAIVYSALPIIALAVVASICDNGALSVISDTSLFAMIYTCGRASVKVWNGMRVASGE